MSKKQKIKKTKQKSKSKFRDVIEILVAVAAAWLFYQFLALALGTQMPLVVVVSGSMEPTLNVGDLILVQKADYNVGDIVLYFRDGITIIHRIIEEQPDGFIIKGDNNLRPDAGVISRERIVGKAIFAVPILGYPRYLLYLIGI